MPVPFDLQGHRGARGLRPENTLPAFEAALDVGATSIETDLHLTRDEVVVLCHEPALSTRLIRLAPGSTSPDPALCPLVRSLTLAQLRGYRADRNPDQERFSTQDPSVSPCAQLYAECHGLDPYTPPALADLLRFAAAYSGDLGAAAGKTPRQQAHAARIRFDLEIKRVPGRPEFIDDGFDGNGPAVLENRVVEILRAARVVDRSAVRSFDHRSVAAVKRLEPRLEGAVLIAGTAPVCPAELVRQAGAEIYCPDVEFLDETQVRQLHAAGIRVIPWTANDPPTWSRLLDWGVDGITTDYPDRLAELLRQRDM